MIFAFLHFSNTYVFEKCAAHPYAAGSSELIRASLCRQADSIGLAVVCLPELISSLCRLVRERKLTEIQYARLKGNVLADIADIDICMVTASVLDHAINALEGAPLRAMDAIHIGCALDYQPDVFVSADHRQVSAAQSRGLQIEHV